MNAKADFNQVIGNTQIINSLKTAIKKNRVSHAYIFSGQEGSGKKLMAYSFAKTLQCEAQGDNACNSCSSCRAFDNGNNPDVFFVTPEGKSLGVSTVRDHIVKSMESKPFKHRYKIFIVEDAHKMTIQAQNAVLKTIEEPKDFGIFLFLAENSGAFLPTILSRCVLYKIKPLGEQQVSDYLKLHTESSPEQIKFVSLYAQGNIGKATKLASDDEFIKMREQMLDIIKKIQSSNLVQVFSFAKEFEAYKERIQEALDIIYIWYRDLAVLKTAGSEFLIQTDIKNRLMESSTKLSLESIFDKLDAVVEAKRQHKYHGNFLLITEVMLIKLWK